MAEKCRLCGEKIEETFLGKLNGTSVKISKNTEKGFCYVCNECQKKHGKNLKKEMEGMA